MSPPLEEDPPKNEKEQDGSWIDAGLLKQVLEEDAIILNINIERATGKGDNYLSIIFRVRVNYKQPDSENVHFKNLIIKGLPSGEYMLQFVQELSLFRREASMYSDVLPKLYAFADSRLGNNAFKRFSAGYHKTDRTDSLILDDLKPEGFVMASRRDRLDFEHAKLIVYAVARLHALSITFTENNPDFLAPWEEFLFCESNRENEEKFIVPILNEITEEVRKWEHFEKIASKLERLKDTLMDKLIDKCKPQRNFQNILTHGDCWVNNFLFKYSETGEPIDLRFVDFQLSRQSSPAMELQYFFFSSLRDDVRILHYDDLLHAYYNELRHSTKELGYGGKLFTFEELCLEMERVGLFGFFTAASILPIVLAHPDDAPDVENIDVDDVQLFGKVYDTPQFRETFEKLLLYFDNRGVLD